jgi:hypothetical protein
VTLDLGAYGNAAGNPPGPFDQPGRRPTRVGALVVALLVMFGVQVTTLVESTSVAASATGPAAAVTGLFAAIGRDDGASAAGYLDLRPGSTRFTDADLRAQTAPAAVEVLAVHRVGVDATVTVGYDLLGNQARSTLALHRSAGRLFTAPRWRLTGGLPVLQVQAPERASTVSVDGRPLALVGGIGEVTVLPGVLGVRLDADLPAAAAEDLVTASGRIVLARLVPDADPQVVRQLDTAVTSQVLTRLEAGLVDTALFPALGTIDLESDGQTLVFIGHVVGVSGSGGQVALRNKLEIIGTADYARGAVTVLSAVTFP